MKQLAAYLVLLIWLPLAALAQDEEKGGLEGLLERSLSSDAMQVTIDGLSGALSSTAVIETLTFTDATGPWMVIEDAELNWTRSALLRGRVSVEELAAGRISVLRAPVGEEQPTELPSAEAQPFQFSLPELPVSIEIERLSANEIVLEEPLLGERVVAVLEGGFRLADGDGAINLNLRRTDVEGTTLELGASFENESEELVVVLDAQAREGGLLARKTTIPGAPALNLSIVGRGLLSDFTADVTFATADATRLGGVVRLLASDIAEGAAGPDRTIQAQLSGDVRPLVTGDLQSFFGDTTAIDFETILAASGKIEVPRLHLQTQQLNLRSRLALSETMWPEKIALFARLDAEPGQPVRLPVPGTPTELSSAYLNFSFDLDAGSIWSAVVTVSDLQQGEMELETLDLRGAGELTLPEADGAGAVSGQLNGGLVGIALPEANLQQAAGDTISFGTGFAWRKGEALEIDRAQVAAGDVALTLEGLFSNLAAGVDFAGAIGLDAPDLSRFSGLAGQDLTGAVALDVDGEATLLSGIFDLEVTGTGTDLQTGIPEADAVLGGTADVAFSGARTTEGITIRTASVQTLALDMQVEGGGSRAATDLTLSARLDDISRVVPDVSGPVELSGTVRTEGDGFRVETELGASDVALTLAGLLSNLNDGVDFEGSINLDAQDLGRFSEITGQALAGDVSLDVEGQATLTSLLFDLDVTGKGTNLQTGIAEADALLAGTTDLVFSGARTTEGITIRTATVNNEALNLKVEGSGSLAAADLTLSARLDDISRVVPDVSGPVELSGTVRTEGDGFRVETELGASDVALTLAGLLSNLNDGVDFDGSINLDAQDLGRFSEITGQALAGDVSLDVEGQATLTSLLFDLDVTGKGTNLQTGIAEADALLAGTTDLVFSGARTTEGITIRTATVNNEALNLQVEGGGSQAETDLILSARLDELSRVLPDLSGPVELSGTVRSEGDGYRVDTEVGASDLALTLAGLFSNLNDGVDFDGDIKLDAEDLSRFSAITGQALSGEIALDVEGQANLTNLLFDMEVRGEGSDLRTGIPQADAVLAGAFALSISGARDTDGITIRQTSITTEALDVQIAGTGNTAESDLTLSARLDNLARLIPEFPGPIDFSGTVRNSGGAFTIDGSGSGPAGLALSVAGSMQNDFSTADLELQGSTRLAIANPFINPRTASGGLSFDIGLQGPLGLDAVNGTVTISDARVADPTIGFSLEQLAGTASLANNAVNLDFQGNGNRGGQIGLGGSLELTGSQIAALVVDINALRLSIQGALQSRVNGRVTLDGPLAGGATLSGEINLDETELRIPDGGGAAGSIQGLRHVGAPGPVRVTLERAGMLDDDKDDPASSGSGAGAPALNLDLLINAPRQIFVRGFGLDAELGGSVKVTGTASAPRPVGDIELQRGRMSILGQRLNLTEGEIQLTASIIPDIRFVASSDSDEYEVSAIIEGPADEPEVTFEATPSLPEDEVLSRLLFRSDVASLSPLQAIQLANSLIAVRNGSGLGFFNQLREGAGLDDLDLRTDEEGRTSLSLGKYISDDVYTNVDINDEGETDVNLNIELTDSVTGRATAGTDNSSLGLFFERDY